MAIVAVQHISSLGSSLWVALFPSIAVIVLLTTVEEEVWHEVALSQLLMLVEIPLLDTILSYEVMKKGGSSGHRASKQMEGCSNLAFKRWESITSLFSEKWVRSACCCMRSLLFDLAVMLGESSYTSRIWIFSHFDSSRNLRTTDRNVFRLFICTNFCLLGFVACIGLSVFPFRAEGDPWVEAAMDTLECHPRGMDMLDLSLNKETDLTQKLRLYQSIADYYTSLPEPLWSEKFVDLHLPLLNLLMQGKEDTALRVLQLSMLLLPPQLKEEMHRLLVFMKLASEEDGSEMGAVQLSSSVSTCEREASFKCLEDEHN